MTTILARASRAADGEIEWRLAGADGGWLSEPANGDPGILQQLVATQEPEVIWLLPGEQVVLRREPFNTAEQRHLARLLPFQLESELACDVNDVHMAIGTPHGGQVVVAWTDAAAFRNSLGWLEEAGVEAHQCVHEAQLLPGSAARWTCVLDGDRVHLRFDDELALTVDDALFPPVLQQVIAQAGSLPDNMLVCAGDEAGVQHLEARVKDTRPDLPLQRRVAGYWDCVSLDTDRLDLRQGTMARAISWGRIWHRWRGAVSAVAAVLLLYVAGSSLEWWINGQRLQSVEEQIVAEYRSVMPDGLLVNPVSQLRTRLSAINGGDPDGAGVMTMLSRVIPVLDDADAVNLERLVFNRQGSELQLSLNAPANADILDLTARLEEEGLPASARNMTARGQRQQALVQIGGDR